MTRSLHRAEIVAALVLAVLGIAAFWLVVQQGSQAAASVATVTPPGAEAGLPLRAVAPSAPGGRSEREAAPDRGGEEPGDTTTLTVRAGETVALRSAPGGEVVAELGSTTEFGSPTVLSVAERRGGWAGVPTHLLPNGELAWVRADDPALEAGSVGVSVEVDLSEMEARLLRGGDVEHAWTVSIGAAESPTPTGRFSITDSIEGGLNPVYGCCALALSATQPNTPPGWTGGNRMAIHGSTEAIGAANSSGCIRSGEEDLRLLLERAPLGTPVVIHE